VDIWCQPLPPGAIARLGNSSAEARAAAQRSRRRDEAADSPDVGSHLAAINSVAMASDGELVATTAADGVRLWQARTGKPLLRLQLPTGSERGEVVVAFGAGDRMLVAAGGCALRRYDLKGSQAPPPIPFAPLASAAGQSPPSSGEGDKLAGADCDVPYHIAVAPGGDLVAVTTSKGLLRRFSLSAERELVPIQLTEPGPYGWVTNVTRPVFSTDGALIAVGLRSELLVMSAIDGAPRMRLLSGWEPIVDLDFAPTGSELAVLTHDRLAIVNPATGKLLRSRPLKRGIHVGGALRYSLDGRRLLVLAEEELSAFDAATARPLGLLASGIDDGAFGRFEVASGAIWVHPDKGLRMLVRELPAPSP